MSDFKPPVKLPHGPTTANRGREGDLDAALSRYAEAHPEVAEPEETSGIEEALERYASEAALGVPGTEAKQIPEGRLYRLGEVGRLLAAFAVALLLFDAEGLLTWARRMEVGRVQGHWLAVLTPLYRASDRLHLTAPRKGLVTLSDQLSSSLGSGEDPLFAQAWAVPGADAEAAEMGATDAGTAVSPLLPAGAQVDVKPLPALAPANRGSSVLLMGDSLIAGSLGGTLSRALAESRHFEVVTAFQTGTGLSQPDLFDWMKLVPPLLERARPSLVVCSLGANDAHATRLESGVLPFGEGAWTNYYRERVLTMMRALTGGGARVLWLGLPPMREPRFAERARVLNRVFEQAAREVNGVSYLELQMLISGPGGGFASFARAPDGRYARLRMDDGVHYSPAGSRAVATWVLDWVNEVLPPGDRKGTHR